MLYINICYIYVFEKSNPIIPNSYHAYISHRRTSVKLFESKYLFHFEYDTTSWLRIDLLEVKQDLPTYRVFGSKRFSILNEMKTKDISMCIRCPVVKNVSEENKVLTIFSTCVCSKDRIRHCYRWLFNFKWKFR